MSIATQQVRVTPLFDDGSVIFRRARKDHRCDGGHDGKQRTACTLPIRKGDSYIEYLGESPAFASGNRYHYLCAMQQGLIEESEDEQ